ncbi:MAG: hypothetical protein ACM30G_15460 [Micromonosporaceae bacterium]
MGTGKLPTLVLEAMRRLAADMAAAYEVGMDEAVATLRTTLEHEVRRSCPDCAVGVGQEHRAGCDVARCLVTGLQRLRCRPLLRDNHDCGAAVWSGVWPYPEGAAT